MKNIIKFLVAFMLVGFVVGCAKKADNNFTQTQTPPQTQAQTDKKPQAPVLQSPLQNMIMQVITANDKTIIDANDFPNTQYVSIIFDNETVRGGIFESQNTYRSDNRRFLFVLESGTLTITEIFKKISFTIKNFSDGDFNIYLSKNPTKEVAIVLNVNQSMGLYINAIKDIAPFIAKHILGDRETQFAKISLITFSYIRVNDLGTFYDGQSFVNATNGLQKGFDSSDNMVNLSLINAMRNFTKFNGLQKEIFLITNGAPDDPQNDETMLFFAKSLQKSVSDSSPVKIHIFSPMPFQSRKTEQQNIALLSKIANATGGSFNQTFDIVEFKTKVLTISNDGKPFDKRELDKKDNEFQIIESIKVFDPES